MPFALHASEQGVVLDALHVNDPRSLEGVWLPAMGGPGPGNAPAAGPAGAAAPVTAPTTPRSADDPPPEIGGLGGQEVPGGPPAPPGPPPEPVGSTLTCTPVQRLGGAGGGMSNLWIQGPHEIVMISEEDMDVARKIYLDAAHPAHVKPQPNGNSIGHWEGNVLLVDSIGFSDRAGRDLGQHVTERIHKEGGTLIDEITVRNRDGSTRTQTNRSSWRPDLHVYENVCEEGFDRYEIVNGQLDNPNVGPEHPK